MQISDLSIQAVAPGEIGETLITNQSCDIKFKPAGFSLFLDNASILPLEYKTSREESKSRSAIAIGFKGQRNRENSQLFGKGKNSIPDICLSKHWEE